MKTLHRRVAGIDVHRMRQVATILIEQEDGSTEQHSREVGGFKRDLRWLVAWLKRYQVELVVMESTGIYWKSLYAHLERAGIETWVVNAHHIKHVPGRKTDMADSHWLAELGRFGLVRPSFIPPQDLRELRMISRYRKKLSGILAGEKNRLHKVLDDAGIKLVPDRKPHQCALPPALALPQRGSCRSKSSGETGMRRGVARNSQ